jgi:hypothetical protein
VNAPESVYPPALDRADEDRARHRGSGRGRSGPTRRRGFRLASATTAVVLTAGLGLTLMPNGALGVESGSQAVGQDGYNGALADLSRGSETEVSRHDRESSGSAYGSSRYRWGGHYARWGGHHARWGGHHDDENDQAGSSRSGPSSATPQSSAGTPSSPSTGATTTKPSSPQPSTPSTSAPVTTPSAPVTTPSAPVTTPSESVLDLPDLSGLGWRSGVYHPGSKPSDHAAFGQWRGRAPDVSVDWSARQTWSDIVNPSWLYSAWAGTPQTKVFGIAMVPEADGSATIANCATGSYNDKWREFGRHIAAAGMADETIIRLGWEFNGDWYKWEASDPAAWAQCWRAIVTSVEEHAPELLWDWTVNRGVNQGLRDARQAYPGDDYVDIVGVDSYDMYPGVRTEADWQQHYAGEYGLKFWTDFAAAHGKPLSVPEWGVYPGTAHAGNNGGDNPFYVQKMVEYFRSMGANLAYEAYFNEDASYYAGSLWGPVQNPNAADAYRRLYG